MIKKAVILAGGLGTRMQKTTDEVDLDKETKEIADKGLKGLVPIGLLKRSFLDYSLSRLIKSGYRQICFVINPQNEEFKNYYQTLKKTLPQIKFFLAFQKKPLGTANATLSSQSFVKNDSFVVLNSDNLYSINVLKTLREFKENICYLPAYDRERLEKLSNIEPEKIKKWAVMDIDKNNYLKKIVEGAKCQEDFAINGRVLISMNIFRFTPEIFVACRNIKPHPIRKEYELASAIQYGIDNLKMRFKTFYVNEGVLDLTLKSDIPFVQKILEKEKLNW